VPPDEAWLDDRFRLFETFCLPSVRAQTARDFHWLVFFDAQTPERFRERALGLARGGCFEPCFVEEGGAPEWQAVRALLPPGCEWVLTTRLDNDDALHTGFVAAVQAAFQPRPELLNLPLGYVLDSRRRRLYTTRQPASPFLSRCEPAADPRTVLQAGAHDSLVAAPRQLEAGPLWLQVVHGRNAANRVTPHMQRVPLASLAAGFQLEGFSTQASESPLALSLENGLRRLSSALRRMARRARATPARA